MKFIFSKVAGMTQSPAILSKTFSQSQVFFRFDQKGSQHYFFRAYFRGCLCIYSMEPIQICEYIHYVHVFCCKHKFKKK